jgi:hypothetical protein
MRLLELTLVSGILCEQYTPDTVLSASGGDARLSCVAAAGSSRSLRGLPPRKASSLTEPDADALRDQLGREHLLCQCAGVHPEADDSFMIGTCDAWRASQLH